MKTGLMSYSRCGTPSPAMDPHFLSALFVLPPDLLMLRLTNRPSEDVYFLFYFNEVLSTLTVLKFIKTSPSDLQEDDTFPRCFKQSKVVSHEMTQNIRKIVQGNDGDHFSSLYLRLVARCDKSGFR